MLLRKVAADPVWYAVAAEQGGLISRRQLLELGLTRSEAATNVDNGRWQRVHPGVYATFTGTISQEQEVWAALLYAGRGAAACCSTALWLFGVIDQKPDALHISIPEARRVERLPDVRMHRRRALNRRDTPVHPAAAPPRLRIEESLLDECATLPEADVIGLVLRAIQRRKTTPGRIEGAIGARSTQPRRALLRDLLAEAEERVASPLELHYRRRVEVPHRLPIGRRNLLDVAVPGRKRYRDVEYERWRLIVELDGQEAHPPDQAFFRHAAGQRDDAHRARRAAFRMARRRRGAVRRRRAGGARPATTRLAGTNRSLRSRLLDPAHCERWLTPHHRPAERGA